MIQFFIYLIIFCFGFMCGITGTACAIVINGEFKAYGKKYRIEEIEEDDEI